MNDILVTLGKGIDLYNAMNDDNKQIVETSFNGVTAILNADISVEYTPTDVEALRQRAFELSTVSEYATDKAEFIIFRHYYKQFKTDGKATTPDGKELKSLQAIATYAGVKKSPKQRGSDFKAILECGIDLTEFKDRSIGMLKAIADAINKGVIIDSITPETTPEQLRALVKQATAHDSDSNSNSNSDSVSNSDSNSDNNSDSNSNSNSNSNSTKDIPHIAYNDNIGAWEFNKATATELQAWIYEHISTSETVDKLLIGGRLVIKVPKS